MQIFGGLWPPCPTSLTYRNYYDQVNHVLLCVFQCPLVAGILSTAACMSSPRSKPTPYLKTVTGSSIKNSGKVSTTGCCAKLFYPKKFPMFQHYQCVQLSVLPSYYQPRFLTPKDANKKCTETLFSQMQRKCFKTFLMKLITCYHSCKDWLLLK